ncbi:MAG TPA: STAS domain-containing protein [Gaiellales bacterium]|nr:STAS domain-containing protein [Gaiellales bacterium]
MRTGQIGVESDGGIRVLVLRGEHDLSTAPDVRAHMEDAVRGEGDLVVDLCETGFIDSSILGVLVAGYRGLTGAEQPRRLAVAAVPGSSVTRLFDLVSVSDVIPVYATRAEAVAALAGASSR